VSRLEPLRLEGVTTSRWREACERSAAAGERFCGLYAGHGASGLQLNAVFAHAGREHVVSAPVDRGAIDTLLDVFPAAAQDEREAHDCYGVCFHGHEPLRPLVSHPPAPGEWTVLVEGDEAYQVAVGPIHAGVIESGHFRFTVVGERILHLDLRLFYKHRGLQAAAEGRALADARPYAQRACAACAVANTVAYVQACEAALGRWPDERTRHARTVLLELERLYNHLNDVSAVCAGVGFAPGAMAFAALKERAQRLNQSLAGHRFLFDTVSLGGTTWSVDASRALAARRALEEICKDERRAWRELSFAASVQERLPGVGRVGKDEAMSLGAVGPSARAAGVRQDTRSESPRLLYDDFAPAFPPQPSGDVRARLETRHVELQQTFELLDALLSGTFLPGRCNDTGTAGGGVGVSRVESPRGETVCVVHTDGEVLERLHLRTGSYANWPLLALAARENLLPDFPLINKSFELCYACVDR